MITDLANLGPMKGTDLGVGKAKSNAKTAQTGKTSQASSFDQILQKKVSDKPTENVLKADKDVKASSSFRKLEPEKVESRKVEASPNKNEPRTARKENVNEDNVKETKSSETRSSESEKTEEKVGKKANDGSTQREQVMLEFMDSMESEFGIPPQRIVEAMANLPVDSQISSPEDSASQVISQLKLSEDQEQKALALYVGMLTQLKQSAEPQFQAAAMATASTAAAVPALMSHQQRRALLNDSLDQMNQQFFMQGQGIMPETVAKELPSMTSGELGHLSQDSIRDQAFLSKNTELPNLQDKIGSSPFPKPGTEHLLKEMQPVDPQSAEGQQLLKSLTALNAAATALDQGIKTDPQNMQALKAEQALNGLNSPTTGAGAAGLSTAALSSMGLGTGDSDEEGHETGGQSSSQDPFAVHQNAGQTHSRTETGDQVSRSFEATMAGLASKDSAQNEANVQSLMKQAQYLIKKGGGEAKIQMAPEGVGQISMKLVLHEGKVNLEMAAETKEAKKLIESSINDLKAGLAQHRMTVDTVRVDVGTQLSSDQRQSESQNQSNPQKQMDMSQDQPKQQARQFWNDFNQNGGFDRRGTFYDNPAIRAYGGSSRQVQALTPNSPGAIGERREVGSGKGRGLNLVA